MKLCPAHAIATAYLLACAASGTSKALAADIHPTTFDDVFDDNDGTCTLREATRSANGDTAVDACEQGDGADRILLSAGTYTLDLASGSREDASLDGDLDIVGPLEILGVSPEYTVIDGVADESQERILQVHDSIEPVVTLQGLQVTGGRDGVGGNIAIELNGNGTVSLIDVTVAGGFAAVGGGIHLSGGSLSVSRSRIEDNEAGSGGGIASAGILVLAASHVAGNTAAQVGGGIWSPAGPVTIRFSTISGNRAAEAGGVFASADAELTVLYSRIEDNEAVGGKGGGMLLLQTSLAAQVQHSAFLGNTASSFGGGLAVEGSTANIRHSTLAGNSAAADGGGGAWTNAGQVLFDSVTIAQNVGGGVSNESGAFFQFSLLADNEGGNCVGNAPATLMLNLDDGNTCRFPASGPNMVNTDPMLGSLVDNGGPTPTFALLPGSPAIDAISSAVKPDCGLSTGVSPPDQRGYPRGYPPIRSGDPNIPDEYLCDIGAFERHAPYIVDATADTIDADSADGICADASGACTLRAAVMQANAITGLEEIELAADTYAITLAGANEDDSLTGDFDVIDPVVIRGQGAGRTIIDAAQLDRAFDFPLTVRALEPGFFSTISDLSIQQGAGGLGGAIQAFQSLVLERTVLQDNNTGGMSDGGAIACMAGCDLRVIDSTLRNNTASHERGGAIAHFSALPLYLERTTLSGNTAGEGGAIVAKRLYALNSTFSGNSATPWSALVATSAVLESSTIFDNDADAGIGVIDGALFVVEPSVIRNSIIADNHVEGMVDNCGAESGALVSVGFNLSDTAADDCNLDEATDLVETDPQVQTLADNDGATQTHALEAGSPAIDAGDAARCPAMDQRGVARPADGDGDGTAVCDIGAYEAPEPEPDPDPPGGGSGGGGSGGGGSGGGGSGGGGSGGGGSGGGVGPGGGGSGGGSFGPLLLLVLGIGWLLASAVAQQFAGLPSAHWPVSTSIVEWRMPNSSFSSVLTLRTSIVVSP